MGLRIDLYVHLPPVPADNRLDEVLRLLKTITTQETRIMNELDALEAQAKANTDAENAAVVLLGQLHDLLVNAQSDPAQLQSVIDQLGASKAALAAAIVANTPAATP